MVKSYDVVFELDENRAGWVLLCYEDDDCVHEQFFRDRSDADFVGHKFLDGCYIKGFVLEDVV